MHLSLRAELLEAVSVLYSVTSKMCCHSDLARAKLMITESLDKPGVGAMMTWLHPLL